MDDCIYCMYIYQEREAVLQGKVNAEQVAVRHMKQLEGARQQEEHPLTNHFVGAQDRLLKKVVFSFLETTHFLII